MDRTNMPSHVTKVMVAAWLALSAVSVSEVSLAKHLLVGVWQGGPDDGSFLQFEEGRLSIWEDSRLVIGKILSINSGYMLVSLGGRNQEFILQVQNDYITIRNLAPGNEAERFRRINETPKQLMPFVIGAPIALSEVDISPINDALQGRIVEDQAVRADPTRATEMHQIDSNNTAYLVDLISRVGWIDATRFGVDACNAAFLLVQHSGDIRLMIASLPFIEKDFRAGNIVGEPFALLYDRVQIMTGEKQRYGSQVGLENGRIVAFPLEDPDAVDALRKEVGLVPLADYLATLRQMYPTKKNN